MAFTTWNASDLSSVTLTGSNLIATATAAGGVRAAHTKRSGKFYWETTFTNVSVAVAICAGLGSKGVALTAVSTSTAANVVVLKSGQIWVNGVSSGTGIAAISSGNVVCHAVDLGARLYWARLGAAGNWNNSAANNPATGVGGVDISATGFGVVDAYPIAGFGLSADATTGNFGASAFSGTVPSGYTSGWDDSISAVTNALATQLAAEHWTNDPGQAQLTQIAAEHWATTANVQIQAVMTQIAAEHWSRVTPRAQLTQIVVEHWATVADAPPSAGGPIVTMIP